MTHVSSAGGSYPNTGQNSAFVAGMQQSSTQSGLGDVLEKKKKAPVRRKNGWKARFQTAFRRHWLKTATVAVIADATWGEKLFGKSYLGKSWIGRNLFNKKTFVLGALWSVFGTYTVASVSQLMRSSSNKTLEHLPSWAKHIKAPNINKPIADQAEALKAEALGKMLQSHGFSNRCSSFLSFGKASVKSFALNQELKWQMRFGSNQYLPDEIKKDLRKLWWNPLYWARRAFTPEQAHAHESARKGPAETKAIQASIGQHEQSGEIAMTRSMQEAIQKYPVYFRKPLHWLAIDPTLMKMEPYKELLNNVPGLPKKAYKPQIEALLQKSNLQGVKFEDVQPLAAGSIGEVFTLEHQGELYVFKLVKPNITNAYLDKQKPFLYGQALVRLGDSPKAQAQAARETEEMIALLKEEIQAWKEADNTKAVGTYLQSQASAKGNLEVAKIFAHTDNGILMSFVKGEDFTDLEDKDRQYFLKNGQKGMSAFLEMNIFSPHKLLDAHAGNIRVDGHNMALIDLGRQANLNKKTHDKLLNVIATVYAARSKAIYQPFSTRWDFNPRREYAVPLKTEYSELLKDANVQKSLMALLNCNGKANEKLIRDLKFYSENSKTGIASPELEALLPNLFLREKMLPPDLASAMNTVPRSKEEKDQMLGIGTKPTLSRVWSNALHNLPGTLGDVAAEDLNASHEKMMQVTEPYFEMHQDAHDRAIQSITDQLWQRLNDTERQGLNRKTFDDLLAQSLAEDHTSWKCAVDSEGNVSQNQLLASLFPVG